jgi:hypothetical protein
MRFVTSSAAAPAAVLCAAARSAALAALAAFALRDRLLPPRKALMPPFLRVGAIPIQASFLKCPLIKLNSTTTSLTPNMSVIDFTNNQPKIPGWLLNSPLRLILWAGDGFHHTSDVERLPAFDMYLCQGYPQNLQANIDYIEANNLKKTICIINALDPMQMSVFCGIFGNRFSHIDSDYIGNTPRLDTKYYDMLLAPGGEAHHIRGINSAQFPTEDFYNVLELFAPVLPPYMNARRKWIEPILNMAVGNGMSPEYVLENHKADLNANMIGAQNYFSRTQLERSLEFANTANYTEATLEEYWSRLPVHILTVNLDRAWRWGEFTGDALLGYYDRLEAHLKGRITMNPDIERYLVSASVSDMQHVFYLQSILPANGSIGYYPDLRRVGSTFDIRISK